MPWLLRGMRMLASATAVSRREKRNKQKLLMAGFLRHLRKVRKRA